MRQRKHLLAALLVTLFFSVPIFSQTNVGGVGGGSVIPSGENGVSPLSFNGKWDVKYVTDAQWSNSSTSVTCPNSNCGFTSADNGKIEFGTIGLTVVNGLCSGAACGQLAIPQGTLTVVSANSATVSIASTGACTVTSTQMCGFPWGTQDDTTSINSAAQAAWNAGNTCRDVVLPAGSAFFSGQILNVTATAPGNPCANTNGNGSQADVIQVGPLVMGQGMSITTLIPLPNFTFANPVIGGTPQAQYHDFGVNGLGQSRNGETHAVSLFQAIPVSPACTGSTVYNIGLNNWAHQATGTIGFDFQGGCGDPVTWNVIDEMFGETSCQINTQVVTSVVGIACFGSNGGNGSLVVQMNGGILNTSSSYILGVMGGGVAVTIQGSGGGIWNSKGDAISTQFAQTSQALTIFAPNVGSTIAVNFDGSKISTSSSNTNAASTLLFASFSSGGLTFSARNTQFIATGANNAFMSLAAGNSFANLGGNTFLEGSNTSTLNGSLTADGLSLQGACTGVSTASQTLGLYGTGPNETLTTCTSTTVGSGMVMSKAGTMHWLQGRATAGGVNASSGVLTVLKNGSATALTCTFGTTTSCNDGLHTVSFVVGDLISFNYTTQAAETLAGVKSFVEWN